MPKRIVLIERDQLHREQLTGALVKHGCEVADFDAGRDALQHLLFSSVSAVLMDYGSAFESHNPVAEGKRMVQEITNIDAFVPLILICDRCDLLDQETTAAADLVLRKPVSTKQIINGLETVLSETLRERAQRKSGYIFAFR